MICALLLVPAPALAAADYVEVLTGLSRAPLDDPQPDYVTVPLRVAFAGDAEPLLAGLLGDDPPGQWDWQIEPFLDAVTEPGANLEVGVSFNLKLSLDGAGDIEPYLKIGTGPLVTTQDTLEQSTAFNFGSFIGAGVHVALTERAALTLETRLRHLSNASIRTPNSGIDSQFWLIGARFEL